MKEGCYFTSSEKSVLIGDYYLKSLKVEKIEEIYVSEFINFYLINIRNYSILKHYSTKELFQK
jgi:hypothetical protein